MIGVERTPDHNSRAASGLSNSTVRLQLPDKYEKMPTKPYMKTEGMIVVTDIMEKLKPCYTYRQDGDNEVRLRYVPKF
jgi:hypothetical protein